MGHLESGCAIKSVSLGLSSVPCFLPGDAVAHLGTLQQEGNYQMKSLNSGP